MKSPKIREASITRYFLWITCEGLLFHCEALDFEELMCMDQQVLAVKSGLTGKEKEK